MKQQLARPPHVCLRAAPATSVGQSVVDQQCRRVSHHLLKLSIEWHPRRLSELVDRLYKVVSLQMTDLRQSLYSHGNYTLAEPFTRFQMPHIAWQVKTSDEKESLQKSFLCLLTRFIYLQWRSQFF